MNTALINLILKYWLIFLHFSEQSSKQTLSDYFFLTCSFFSGHVSQFFPTDLPQKNGYTILLIFWFFLFMSFHFSSFCWDVIQKTRLHFLIHDWCFRPYMSECFFIFPHKCCQNNAATPFVHLFFKDCCCCPFNFLHFCWNVVAKKPRLHFWGVKWQKLWGILCFRASMKIPRK